MAQEERARALGARMESRVRCGARFYSKCFKRNEVKEERMEREKWQQARMLYERFQAEERLKLRKERTRLRSFGPLSSFIEHFGPKWRDTEVLSFGYEL